MSILSSLFHGVLLSGTDDLNMGALLNTIIFWVSYTVLYPSVIKSITWPCHIMLEFSEGRFNYDLPNIDANFTFKLANEAGNICTCSPKLVCTFWICYGRQLYYCFMACIIKTVSSYQFGGEVWG
jgi:hypothetical protein